MDMKRFFLYAIVIAALAVAGCNGNGGGGMAPDPDPMPDPMPDPDPMMMDLPLSGLSPFFMMLGDADKEPQDILPGDSRTSGDVEFTCPAGGAVCTVQVMDDMTVEYDSNGGTPTVANSQEAMDTMAEMAETAKKIAPAIVDPDGNTKFPEKGDLIKNKHRPKFDDLGVKVDPLTHDVLLGKEAEGDGEGEMDGMVSFVPGETPLSLDKKWINDWMGSRQMRTVGSVKNETMETTEDMVTVYTNVEKPDDETWEKYYEVENRPGVAGVASTAVGSEGEITLDIDEDNLADSLQKLQGLFMVEICPRNPRVTGSIMLIRMVVSTQERSMA